MKYAYVLGLILVSLIVFSDIIYAEDQNSKDVQELLNRVDDLEKQLKRLEEQNKARKSLEVTEEEKAAQEKEVLEAVSRDYALSPEKTLSIDYGLSYSYTPSELVTYKSTLELTHIAQHTITHSITGIYSLRDNLAVSMGLPIVYRYDKEGTVNQKDQTDIGDISLGATYQPFKSIYGDISATMSFSVALPTGRSPYKINPDKELSTGGGNYAYSVGANFSKQVDPVVAFWSLGIGYAPKLTGLDHKVSDTYTLKSVEPGMSFSAGGGIGYALSYATSLNMSFNYAYAKSTTYVYKEVAPVKSGDTVGASFGIGMGWRVSAKTTLSYSLGYSLTGSSFSFSFRVPFNFVL